MNQRALDVQNIEMPKLGAGIEVSVKASESKTYNPNGVIPIICSLTLVGNRLGGGIVGLPFAIMTVGYTASICFMIVHATLCYFSFCMLLRVREMINRASLSDCGVYCYGKYSIYLINVLIGLAQLGYPIIFFIVFGDVSNSLIEKMIGEKTFFSTRWFTHPMLAVCMLYLIIKKEIHQLKYAGIVLF